MAVPTHRWIRDRIVCVFGLLLFAGCATGTRTGAGLSAEASRYGHILHDRFYEAWIQPKAVAVRGQKISVPVDVQIDRDGRVMNFRIAEPSGNERIDRSIAEVGRKITHVTPPPLAATQQRFDLRIYFELDVKR